MKRGRVEGGGRWSEGFTLRQKWAGQVEQVIPSTPRCTHHLQAYNDNEGSTVVRTEYNEQRTARSTPPAGILQCTVHHLQVFSRLQSAACTFSLHGLGREKRPATVDNSLFQNEAAKTTVVSSVQRPVVSSPV